MLTTLLLVAALAAAARAVVRTQPEQVHLSLGEEASQIVVTWVTFDKTNSSVVEYGLDALDTVAVGTQKKFTDRGSEKRVMYVHKATMRDVKPGVRYVYHVGSPTKDGGWSDLFTFKGLRTDEQWSPRFAVYGDMGNVNAQSIARLQEETQRGHFDAVLHVGDFAYNMDDDNGRVGDGFMRQIEAVAAYVPYMATVGNHEAAYNFLHYRRRFSMPGSTDNMFYSFDLGPVHFVTFSSEFYYYVEYGWEQIAMQYKWLERDLAEANKPENRKRRPWIVTMCHRPLYCSNSNDPQHCGNPDNVIRIGLPLLNAYSIERLLYKYGVDLHFAAHEHSYERMFPVYNNTVCTRDATEPYKNPTGPVHIITGSAGCQELVDPFIKLPHAWSAFHSSDYGYTRMTVHNGTHLSLEQVSDDQGGRVIDAITLEQQNHGPHTCAPTVI